jgi:hypothetical protein
VALPGTICSGWWQSGGWYHFGGTLAPLRGGRSGITPRISFSIFQRVHFDRRICSSVVIPPTVHTLESTPHAGRIEEWLNHAGCSDPAYCQGTYYMGVEYPVTIRVNPLIPCAASIYSLRIDGSKQRCIIKGLIQSGSGGGEQMTLRKPSKLAPVPFIQGWHICPTCSYTERKLGLQRNSICQFQYQCSIHGDMILSRASQDTTKTERNKL